MANYELYIFYNLRNMTVHWIGLYSVSAFHLYITWFHLALRHQYWNLPVWNVADCWLLFISPLRIILSSQEISPLFPKMLFEMWNLTYVLMLTKEWLWLVYQCAGLCWPLLICSPLYHINVQAVLVGTVLYLVLPGALGCWRRKDNGDK